MCGCIVANPGFLASIFEIVGALAGALLWLVAVVATGLVLFLGGYQFGRNAQLSGKALLHCIARRCAGTALVVAIPFSPVLAVLLLAGLIGGYFALRYSHNRLVAEARAEIEALAPRDQERFADGSVRVGALRYSPEAVRLIEEGLTRKAAIDHALEVELARINAVDWTATSKADAKLTA